MLRKHGFEAVIYDNLSTGYALLIQDLGLVRGDIADAKKLAGVIKRVDAVMHFAAHAYVGESVENPRKYYQNNLVGSLVLLNAVMETSVRKVIFSSTCAVYGVPVKVPITEENPHAPVNP